MTPSQPTVPAPLPPAPAGRMAMLSLLAAALGIAVGGVAWALFKLIALVTNLSFYGRWSWVEAVPSTAHWHGWVVLVPAVGGLIVGLIARYGSPKIRGHGIDAVIESVLFHRSRVDPEVAIFKPLSSAVVIGTGGPFGVEGPIIQTGGAVGSVLGQLLHLTAAERKTLLAAGAAAGLAATFSTPMAAVLLAIELILFEYKPRSFIPLVVATTLATAVRLLLMGPGPMMEIAAADYGFPRALPWYLLLGLLCGLAAAGFTRALAFFENLFDHLAHWRIRDFWWPTLGGLGLGLIGWVVPRTLGSGYGTIADILNNRLTLAVLLAVFLAKPLALLLALGSRTSGGTLAPMFMTGAGLGALFAHAVNAVLPAAALSPAACAVLAMAAFFGAAARAPFALILFAFEMTRDYNAVLPLMLAVVAAHGVALALMRDSVMTLSLGRRGLRVHQEYEVDIFHQVTVGQVMDPHPAVVSAATVIGEISRRISKGDPAMTRHQALLLADDRGELAGILTRRDLARALERDPAGRLSALDAGRPDPQVCHPDETLHEAVGRMLHHGCGRLPVVARDNPKKIMGYLGRTAVLEARRQRFQEEGVAEPGWLKTALRSSPH